MATAEFPNLTLLDHPLIQHKLTLLRDRRTTTKDFKQLVNEIAMLMAYEVTKNLPVERVDIETPLERTTGVQVAGKKLTLVPILRAGLGMVEGIAQLIPSARVGHIGLYRDHDTLEPVDYYFKIPSGEHDRDFFVLDPMLATGGSAVAAVAALKDAGRRTTLESAMAKLYSSEIAVRAADDGVQIHGGYGFIKDYPAEKFFRDVKLTTIGEGTSEIQRLVIARQLLAS